MNQDNGGIIGKINTPTTLVASGVWSLQDQFESQSSSIWPLAFPRTTFTNACRFNDGSSDSLYKTFSGNGNRKTFTFSAWVKRGIVSSGDHCLIATSVSASDDNTMELFFQGGDKLAVGRYYNYNLITNALFRDPSAWYHIVLACDTTQSTAANRMRLYVNSSEITSFATASYPSQNDDLPLLAGSQRINIAAQYYTHLSQNTRFLDGYMTEVIMVDGQQLTPTSFGATNPVTNIWEPIAYTGTYGTNGYKLNFSDSSNLGDDTSGNANDWTVSNLTSVDQSTDTCSNNFCTMNPLCRTNGSFSNGNLELDQNGSTGHTITSTFGVENGKWYWEAKLLNWNSSNSRPMIGVNTGRNSVTGTNEILGYSGDSDGIGYNLFGNNVYQNGSIIESSSDMGGSVADNDIYMFALDKDNNKFYIGRNGTFLNSGDPTTGSTGTGAIGTISSTKAYFPATGSNDNSSNSSHNNDWQFNFGSPVHSISSGNADANGFGNFEYAVPSGYFALCTKNLAEFG